MITLSGRARDGAVIFVGRRYRLDRAKSRATATGSEKLRRWSKSRVESWELLGEGSCRDMKLDIVGSAERRETLETAGNHWKPLETTGNSGEPPDPARRCERLS